MDLRYDQKVVVYSHNIHAPIILVGISITYQFEMEVSRLHIFSIAVFFHLWIASQSVQLCVLGPCGTEEFTFLFILYEMEREREKSYIKWIGKR